MCVILFAMSTEGLDRLRAAARAYRRAENVAKQRRTDLVDLIVEAATAKVEQKAIVEATGFTREHVRRILRENGVEGEPRGGSMPFQKGAREPMASERRAVTRTPAE